MTGISKLKGTFRLAALEWRYSKIQPMDELLAEVKARRKMGLQRGSTVRLP